MARFARVSELVFAAVATLLVVVSAVGWLYLLRNDLAPLPGPRIADALPLDELPGHDAVALLAFVAVWCLAAVLLGQVAAAARVERLVAAFLFALAAGSLLFAATGVSIFVVRQIPAGEAFKAAQRVPALYLAAALAGLGGALLAPSRRRAWRRAPVLLAAFVAASGVLDVASAVTPAIDSRLRLIENATPNAVPRLASALVVPAGIALVLLARGLARRRRRAWQLTVCFVFAAAALHLLKGLDYEEAIANIAIGLFLVARRHDFEGRGDPSVRLHLLRRALLYAGILAVYVVGALWINRIAADRPFSFGYALHETVEAMAGVDLTGSQHLHGPFGEWFPLSVFLLTVAGVLSLLWSWLAPWRYRLSQHAQERERAHAIVSRFGIDTLAPFALRADKSYFFAEDEESFLAYRVVAGVAVVSGDPIGPEEAVPALLERFVAFAHERAWRLAVLGASDRFLGVYRRLGLQELYHGDEAVIDVTGFDLDGRAIRKVRQSVSRLERAGYTAELLYAEDVHDELRAELEELAREWRAGEPQKGFTMELDALFRLEGTDALFAVGRDADRVPQGFFHFVVSRPGRALSLSSMPRRVTTPNGFNEWLVVRSVEWARANGFERVSLNFAPFAAVLGVDPAGLSTGARLQRRALLAVKGRFQLDNLLAFNRKFFPQWERRYVVYERVADLPRVGLAGLAAEGYLPLTGTRE